MSIYLPLTAAFLIGAAGAIAVRLLKSRPAQRLRAHPGDLDGQANDRIGTTAPVRILIDRVTH